MDRLIDTDSIISSALLSISWTILPVQLPEEVQLTLTGDIFAPLA
jgi:hypothetical protein